jgi:AcrR family transcriptional regulator
MVLDAALTLLVARGFDGVSVPDIAAEAAVAVGSIYRVAPSKQALGLMVWERAQGNFNAHVFAPFPAGRSLRERFCLFWQRLTAWTMQEPVAAHFLLLHRHIAYASPNMAALQQPWRDATTGFVREGNVLGVLKDVSPALLSAIVLGPIMGLLAEGEASPEALARLESVVWGGLTAP